MAWFSKKPRIATTPEPTRARPRRMQGLWAKCESCDEIIYRQELEKNLNVCPHCDHHLPWPARARLAALLDPDTFEEFDKELEPQDPLGFSDSKKYKDRLKSTRKDAGRERRLHLRRGPHRRPRRSPSAASSSSSWAAPWARWWARR